MGIFLTLVWVDLRKEGFGMKTRTKANKKLVAIFSCVFVMVVSFLAFGMIKSKASNVITVHFQADSTPNIYYWNLNNSGEII